MLFVQVLTREDGGNIFFLVHLIQKLKGFPEEKEIDVVVTVRICGKSLLKNRNICLNLNHTTTKHIRFHHSSPRIACSSNHRYPHLHPHSSMTASSGSALHYKSMHRISATKSPSYSKNSYSYTEWEGHNPSRPVCRCKCTQYCE